MSTALPLRLRVTGAFALTSAAVLVGLGLYIHRGLETTLLAQVDESLETHAEAIAELDPGPRLRAALGASDESFGQVLDEAGGVLASSSELSGPLLSRDEAAAALEDDLTVRRQVPFGDESEPAQLLAVEHDDQVIVVGTSVENVEEAMAAFRSQLAIGVPAALLLASATGYLVAGAALRPIEEMRRQAATISAASSGERLTLPEARDEVHRLGQTLNAMLDRLDAGLRHERRFVAEASYELRTPLALLRLELDLALSRSRSSTELLDSLRSADEEVRRLSALAEDLLLLASPPDPSQAAHTSVDVQALLEGVADRFRVRAGSDGRRITVAADDALVVHGDPGRLDRAVSNLVDNALRHGGGDVELAARAAHGAVVVSVTDHGPGIDPELAPRPAGSCGSPSPSAPGSPPSPPRWAASFSPGSTGARRATWSAGHPSSRSPRGPSPTRWQSSPRSTRSARPAGRSSTRSSRSGSSPSACRSPRPTAGGTRRSTCR